MRKYDDKNHLNDDTICQNIHRIIKNSLPTLLVVTA